MPITRHEFIRLGGVAAAALMLRPFADAADDGDVFHVALIADSHIIDDCYRGP